MVAFSQKKNSSTLSSQPEETGELRSDQSYRSWTAPSRSLAKGGGSVETSAACQDIGHGTLGIFWLWKYRTSTHFRQRIRKRKLVQIGLEVSCATAIDVWEGLNGGLVQS
jgi:hypothetical protein